jgi:hypothetical protein
MGWLNLGGKKRKQAQGFGNSKQGKSRPRRKTFILEKIVTPSAGVGGWLQDFDPLHQLLGSLSLSDLHLPNFLADSGVCPIDPSGAPTNNLPPLIDFDPLGLYHDGIATQTPYNPGGAFETLPIAVIPVDPHSPNPNNPNAIRQLLDFPLASQPLLGSIDTGVSADSPYLNYANIKKGRDYVGGDDNPLLKPGEGSEHGTFMLGIIDAINKTAPKWVGRAIDSGRWADSLVEFVDAAKASGQKNAIANLSLDLTQKNPDGSVTTRYELTPQERSAIEYARQNGVMLVVAAGNDGGVMSVLGQASQEFDNIFTVGAGDINGRSNYSSYGRGLDIVADGGTSEHPGLSTVGDDLGTMAGTSVATAKVAGAASLVWAANPALNYRQVMEILESTARDLGTPGWDDETGFGFLNTLAAVDLAKKTVAEVYQPTDFGTPTTWGGEGKVTPSERAVNFNGAIDWGKTSVQNNAGVNLRSGPGTGYDILGRISSGDTLEFDSQTEGDFVNDPNGEGSSSTWYRLADGSGWMSGLYVQYLGEIASPSPSPDPSPSPSPDPSPSPSPDPSPSPSPDPSPSPSPNPSPSPISTFSQIVQDVGYVHDLGYLRVRNGPGTDASGYQQVGTVSPGNTLIFDGQTQGESVYDPALGESTTWYRLADGSGWVSGLYMGVASTPTPSPSPSPTQPNPFDDVRQMFWDAARQYPQVGNAITDVQDQGGGVFRQEFERAIMIGNGQQVTVYETKGRSASTTSPSSKPAPVNNINWQNFSLQIGATKGVNLRNSPQFGDRSSTSIPYQVWMEFDGWTYGEPVNDLWNGQPDSLWLKVKGQNLWVPSAYMIGYPPGYKQPGSSGGNTGNTGNNDNTGGNQSLIAALRTAIFGQESGYNYKAVNPHSGALGIAQVMPDNIPSWSREALGYQITDNQFLNSPDLQLKIIDYKLNQYYQQAIAASGGNLDIAVRRVASAWYSGNPNKYNSTTPEYTNGVQYPSIANYTLSVLGKFQQAYGGGSVGPTGSVGIEVTPIKEGPIGVVEIGVTPIDDPILGVERAFSHSIEKPFSLYIPDYIVEGTTEVKVSGKLVADSSTISLSQEEVKLKQKIDNIETSLKIDTAQKNWSISLGSQELELGESGLKGGWELGRSGFSGNIFTGKFVVEGETKISGNINESTNQKVEGSLTGQVSGRYHRKLEGSAQEKVAEFVRIIIASGENREDAYRIFLEKNPDVENWIGDIANGFGIFVNATVIIAAIVGIVLAAVVAIFGPPGDELAWIAVITGLVKVVTQRLGIA